MKLALMLLAVTAVLLLAAACGSAPQSEIEAPPTHEVDAHSGASRAPDGGSWDESDTALATPEEPAPDAGTE